MPEQLGLIGQKLMSPVGIFWKLPDGLIHREQWHWVETQTGESSKTTFPTLIKAMGYSPDSPVCIFVNCTGKQWKNACSFFVLLDHPIFYTLSRCMKGNKSLDLNPKLIFISLDLNILASGHNSGTVKKNSWATVQWHIFFQNF